MAQVGYAARALSDLVRLEEFAPGVKQLILDATRMLADHPLLGPLDVERGVRKLVISRGKTAYVALYRYYVDRGLVRVASIRHQREAGR